MGGARSVGVGGIGPERSVVSDTDTPKKFSINIAEKNTNPPSKYVLSGLLKTSLFKGPGSY